MNSAQARRLRTMTNALRCSVEPRPCSRYFEHDAIASSIAASAFRRQPIGEAMRARFEALPAFERQHVAALATSYAIARLKAYPIAGDDARVERAVGVISATSRPARSPYHEIGARYGAPVLPARPLAPQTGAPADLFELAGNEVGRGAAVTAGVAATAPFPFQIGPRSAADADDTPNAGPASCASSAPFRRSVRT